MNNNYNKNLLKSNYIRKNFFLCGLTGWCMEVMWTGFNSIIKHSDPKLTCNTSVWMFPIYGMAAFISPVSKRLAGKHTLLRGGIYMVCIFITEYSTGSLLKKYGVCPWDYSKAKLNLNGLIRFDFAPLWFIAGLVFEKLLCTDNPKKVFPI